MGIYKGRDSQMKFLDLIRPSVLSICITCIILFIVVLLQANLTEQPTPIRVTHTDVKAWHGSELIVLEYTRSFSIEGEFIGTVIRSVKCTNGRNYDLPDTTRKFKEGTFTTHRSVVLPYTIPVGTKCMMTTSVAWQPSLAFVKHIQDIEEVPFTVETHSARKDTWLPTNEEG